MPTWRASRTIAGWPRSPGFRSTRTCSPRPWPTTSHWASPARGGRISRRPPAWPGRTSSSAALPGGYDTQLTEGARSLSAGQRQKIALARAFLRQAPVLLLDEPTAHLDPASADAVMTAIATRMADRTVILITHQPPPRADRAARILALDAGPAQRPGRAGGRTMIARYDPLLRLLRLALGSRPLRGRLLLAVAAGAAATGCGVALLAVSGFLLARASQHPSILAISAAVVAVRALSAGRESPATSSGSRHTTPRSGSWPASGSGIYRRLERLAPAGLAEFSSGDLLARLVSDVDATQDLFIRGIAPPLAAALVGAGVGRRLPADPRARRGRARRRAAGGRDRCPGARGQARRAARPGGSPRRGASSPPASPTSWPARPSCTLTAPGSRRWPR